ncbi:MAG: TonB family protein [Burkholderiaceae bacterium]|nr:TonB family protein [Burkholderiaceae bacterium]
MDFSNNEVSFGRRYGGIGIVVLLHVLVAYAVVSGLAHQMIDAIKKPVETKIIEEVKPPPPPEAPPPPPPKMTAPPPPFIPPPEVNITPPVQQNVISATSSVAPAHQDFRPSQPPAQAAPVGPPAPPIAAISDLNACKPEYPRASMLAEETGLVTLQFVIGADGQIVSVTVLKSSGFKNLDKATINGLSRCKFKPGYKDGKPVQSTMTAQWNWKLDE